MKQMMALVEDTVGTRNTLAAPLLEEAIPDARSQLDFVATLAPATDALNQSITATGDTEALLLRATDGLRREARLGGFALRFLDPMVRSTVETDDVLLNEWTQASRVAPAPISPRAKTDPTEREVRIQPRRAVQRQQMIGELPGPPALRWGSSVTLWNRALTHDWSVSINLQRLEPLKDADSPWTSKGCVQYECVRRSWMVLNRDSHDKLSGRGLYQGCMTFATHRQQIVVRSSGQRCQVS